LCANHLCPSVEEWQNVIATLEVKPLEPPDSLYLRAAEGWLDLGNAVEARAEVERIRTRLRGHPDVLEVRWQICARTKHWECALGLARTITEQAPEQSNGWINFAFALHELQRTQEAWDHLFAVAERFPTEPTVAYNLACYGAQLGRLWEAEQWLKQAFKVGEPRVLKPLALADVDLKPLWDVIAKW
jgi:predicted Zn-dependent protease